MSERNDPYRQPHRFQAGPFTLELDRWLSGEPKVEIKFWSHSNGLSFSASHGVEPEKLEALAFAMLRMVRCCDHGSLVGQVESLEKEYGEKTFTGLSSPLRQALWTLLEYKEIAEKAERRAAELEDRLRTCSGTADSGSHSVEPESKGVVRTSD